MDFASKIYFYNFESVKILYSNFPMGRTLVILKPSAIQRGIIGEIITRFEKKGLVLIGLKMMQLNDAILNIHYSHLAEKPYFNRVKSSMMACPVIVCCWEGKDAINVVHNMAGATNGRNALPGTIRGDYSMSHQENIVHTSDSVETARKELNLFFTNQELYNYQLAPVKYLYGEDEID